MTAFAQIYQLLSKIKSLFKPLVKDGKLNVTFLPSDKQKDGVNCGLLVILDGQSPSEYAFKIDEMRNDFLQCLSEENLLPFQPTTKATRSKV